MNRARLYRIVVVAAVVALLEVLCDTGVIDKITMPPPHRIVIDFFRLFASGHLNAEILKSLGNALLILVVQVPIMIALAVGLAYLLNQAWLRFRSGFRLITFLPAITTLVAYSVVFRVIMTTDGGLLNQALAVFGVAPIDWLNNEFWARVAVIASITWRWTGYNMVIILAGCRPFRRSCTRPPGSTAPAAGRRSGTWSCRS